MEYTGASELDIVAHSMGVTLARKLIQGSTELDVLDEVGGACQLGQSIRKRVHTLIGISGANYGLCMCANPEFSHNLPACGKHNGFWAGSGCKGAQPDECSLETPNSDREHCHSSGQYATILRQLNATEQEKDAHFVVKNPLKTKISHI